jgi:hypothetical protein
MDINSFDTLSYLHGERDTEKSDERKKRNREAASVDGDITVTESKISGRDIIIAEAANVAEYHISGGYITVAEAASAFLVVYLLLSFLLLVL